MASANVFEFTDDNFQQEVLNAQVPVLVDFWAEWCMPCRMLTPTIEQIATEMNGKVKVGKLDVDAHRAVAAKYGIQAIPTVMIFHKGALHAKKTGLQSKADLVAAIQSAIAS
jgi:thioredoxin 1